MPANISLAQRISNASCGRDRLPRALGIYSCDFYAEVGAMTGQEAQYQSVYEQDISPLDGADGAMKCLYDLVVEVSGMEEDRRQDLLLRLLVEPLAQIQEQQND